MTRNRLTHHVITLASSALLAACAIGPNYEAPGSTAVPQQWFAATPKLDTAVSTQPLPHSGKAESLINWWEQFDDTLLAQLVAAAQRESDTLAGALARIEQARAGVAAARSGLWPNASLNASGSRGDSGPNNPQSGPSSNARAAIDALWELDFFGGNRRNREAAVARYESSVAGWHAARVSLAAEVASAYVGYRTCEALLKGFEADHASRKESDRLTQLKVQAGFTAPAEGALSSASVAEASNRLAQQRAECDITVKALVALTAVAEPQLREQLKAASARLPQPRGFSLDALPAALLAQRPDVAAAERELAAANADIGAAMAARLPRVSLTGSIGWAATRYAGVTNEGRTWSFGPALDLPLFDAGRRAANVDASRAQYQAALANYKARVRGAVSEVEQALVSLSSAQERVADTRAAATGYEAFLKAADSRYRAGAGSLIELEESRRALLAAQVTALTTERERITAWITLYKALGGGWTADTPAPVAQAAHTN
jgi:NodT family efflux transporter outer membrane factor (OMF) lipoprotein